MREGVVMGGRGVEEVKQCLQLSQRTTVPWLFVLCGMRGKAIRGLRPGHRFTWAALELCCRCFPDGEREGERKGEREGVQRKGKTGLGNAKGWKHALEQGGRCASQASRHSASLPPAASAAPMVVY